VKDITPIELYEYMVSPKPDMTANLPSIKREFAEGNGVQRGTGIIDTIGKAIELRNADSVKENGLIAESCFGRDDWEIISGESEGVQRIAAGME